MKVAIIHYWWLTNRGGEAVVSRLFKIFPNADLFVHVCDDELVRETLGKSFSGNIFKTFISKFPWANRKYQNYLPLMPMALEQIDLTEYDLVISSESGPAKGVITRPDALHVCYCHSPMRYVWDMYFTYIKNSNFLIKIIFPFFAHRLRLWDRLSADRVDYFIANSNFINKRINKYYRRSSDVIHPPVDVQSFEPLLLRESFYLCLGQLTHYKRIDLAVNAFNKLGFSLVIIGEGEELDNLTKISNENISFLGRQSNSVIKWYLEHCRALIFPGVEDFGIVPVEAMAAGAPVIAYASGGVLDTVINNKTGILFPEQNIDSLIEAVMKIESGKIRFDPENLHKHALNFDSSIFDAKVREFIASKISTISQSDKLS